MKNLLKDGVSRARKDQSGLTLIELALVITVHGLILLAVLIAYQLVVDQRKLTELATEIAVVRHAVTNWASGHRVYYPRIGADTDTDPLRDDPKTLSSWSQIAGFLDMPMAGVAKSETTMTLTGANPWDGNYVLAVYTATPRTWSIEVFSIPKIYKSALQKRYSFVTRLPNVFTDSSGADATDTFAMRLYFEE